MTIKHTQPPISISVIMIGVVGEVTLGQRKTPSFKMGHSVSLAESERFELSQDCYTLTD